MRPDATAFFRARTVRLELLHDAPLCLRGRMTHRRRGVSVGPVGVLERSLVIRINVDPEAEKGTLHMHNHGGGVFLYHRVDTR